MFGRREAYAKWGGFNRSLHMGMDPDLWCRFSEIGPVGHVRRYWSRMRFYPEIKSLTMKPQMLAEHRKLENRYFGDRPELVRQATRALAKIVRVGYRLGTGCYWA